MKVFLDQPWRGIVGRRCAIVFDLNCHDWPIPGTPAWAVVAEVRLPLIKLRSEFGEDICWVNVRHIKRIVAYPKNGKPGPGILLLP